MAKRGRPVQSDIRQRLIEILFFAGKAYGYELHKMYVAIFPKCTREVVYYHLKKGCVLGEFAVESIRQEKGLYSWGGIVEKKYYKLGPSAKPTGEARVKEYFDTHKRPGF